MAANNWQSFVQWGRKAFSWGWYGAAVGFVLGAAWAIAISGGSTGASSGDSIGALFGTPIVLAVTCAAIPATVAAWFLLLHMVSQLSGAARVPVARVEKRSDWDDDDDADDEEAGQAPTKPAPRAAPKAKPLTEKVCPDCGESVKAAARICRFCRYDFASQAEQ